MKRRTKAQKVQVKHPFLVSWNEPEKQLIATPVKGQIKSSEAKSETPRTTAKKANLLDKDDYLSTTRRDVIRSLLVTSLILGTEIVLYLAWM